jgi:gamma-glutamylcysteine synthetase
LCLDEELSRSSLPLTLTQTLNLTCDIPVSNFDFKCNVYHYSKCNEENFVDGLMEMATSGKTSSDRLLEAYENEWNGDIDKIFKRLTY